MEEYTKKLEEENRILKDELEKIKSISEKKRKTKRGFLKFIAFTFAGKRLKKSFYNVINQYDSKKHVSKEAVSDLLASIVYRFTRIGLFTLIFALLPFVLLIQQNILLKQQNKRIEDQNHLAEASRRSAQMFIMGDVLSDINKERKVSNILSSPLIGRIASLSRAMKPYRFFENGKLNDTPISPERGQLLLTITTSELSNAQLSDEIFQNSDFTYADLSGVTLKNAYLKDIDLSHADLSHSNLGNTNMVDALLTNANLYNAYFFDANLKFANLKKANLKGANLMYAKVENVDFTGVQLDSVLVHRMDWLKYINKDLSLSGSEELIKKYKIDSVYVEEYNKKIPMILEKSMF